MAACRKISFFESLDFTLGARSIIMGRKIRGKLSGGYEKGRMEESMSKMTEQKQDRLIIVIPAYNEEENIENVVSQWHPIVEKTVGCLSSMTEVPTIHRKNWRVCRKSIHSFARSKKKIRGMVRRSCTGTAVRLQKEQITFSRPIPTGRPYRRNSGSYGQTEKSAGF